VGAGLDGGQLAAGSSVALKPAHRRRLREIWRSAGWPCHDALELDLLAAGLLARLWDGQGRGTLRVTESGIELLAATRRRNQAAFAEHESLVARVARDMQRDGRVVWCRLSLRAPLAAEDGSVGWAMAMPDVFSIRHTTVEDYTEPVVHEIKVSRADLLSDLRSPTKGAAYRALASQCWYVLRRGIAEPDELPAEYGVMLADDSALVVARPAPRRALRVPFAVWMTLARAAPEPGEEIGPQAALVPVQEEPGPS
jgi:hypothetical protein